MESTGSRRDVPDALRGIGGIVFAAGGVVLVLRKAGGDEWSTLARFFTVLVPAVLLYAVALAGGNSRSGTDTDTGSRDGAGRLPRRGSSALLLVASLLLLLTALFLFLSLVKASAHHKLYIAAVFAVAGLAAAFGARRARVAYGALLAGLAFLVVWLQVWEQILGNTTADEGRWLTVAAGALLLAAALIAVRRRSFVSREIATAGGIAAVFAGLIGIFTGIGLAFLNALPFGGSPFQTSRSSGIASSSRRAITSFSRRAIAESGSRHFAAYGGTLAKASRHGMPHIRPIPRAHLASLATGAQTLGWDIYLLVVSLALLAIGARSRSRGLAYVGGAGLLAFLLSVGAELTRIEAGKHRTHGVVGWPLALLLIGAVALVGSLVASRSRTDKT